MADISIWQKTGHFYFALTDLSPLGLRVGLRGRFIAFRYMQLCFFPFR
jgi:hypothetical protein